MTREPEHSSSLPPSVGADAWLSAVVESSDDAIVSKTLDGIIQSWNPAAERLFGYSPAEAIGSPIQLIIPPERLGEEDHIIGRLRRGERVHHFETIRRRKDGHPVEVSLTVSPVRDQTGLVVGASKIARDISEARRAAERQTLLLGEMHHRTKNLFAMMSGLLLASAREASDVPALVQSMNARIVALSRAHALTLPDLGREPPEDKPTSLKALLEALTEPHLRTAASVSIEGDDVAVGPHSLTMLALLLHELATNAAKYGALSHAAGQLSVQIDSEDHSLGLVWTETGGLEQTHAGSEGFGSLLERTVLRGFDGALDRRWTEDGVVITLRAPMHSLTR